MATDSELLTALRTDPASWPLLVRFTPTDPANPDSDANQRARYVALLALHTAHQPAPLPADEALVLYLIDQEILFHRAGDQYRSALSLAAYLLARFRIPRHLWAIWAAREANFDASKSVDPHLMYYAAGSMEGAEEYVEGCQAGDILAGAADGGGRQHWYASLVEEDYAGDEGAALKAVKKDVLDRIKQDRTYGVTDDKVVAFVDSSWRSNTQRWGESLLPLEY
ncbi:hypothetical protein BV25DRAFT_1906949 [Artomyces pyxidatus]|uniref:Uncharacterized protein n=1 Tax=Artomyces pyxidatus TaxID=48021 RepID=A0ACB8T6E1_9AGAM|nr:hypothetical protein BV25DRAFT_1906949 [Artomyces pyxidatus]